MTPTTEHDEKVRQQEAAQADHREWMDRRAREAKRAKRRDARWDRLGRRFEDDTTDTAEENT